MTYTEKELDQFLHGISLSLLSKKSAQHWRYDEETAREIEWLEALERKVRADKADRKTENNSEIPNNCEDEPQTESLEQFRVDLEYHTDTTHFGKVKGESITTNKVEEEPQTETKMKTQNSNLTFEKVDEPTISKMEQVDKDINVRSKDCTTCKHAGEVYEDPCELCYRHSHYEPKDEPQTDCDHRCIQTEIGCERTDCP